MGLVMLPGFTRVEGCRPDRGRHAGNRKGQHRRHLPGSPVTIFNYSSQVFPPLLMAILSPLYREGEGHPMISADLRALPRDVDHAAGITATGHRPGPGVYAGPARRQLTPRRSTPLAVHLRRPHSADLSFMVPPRAALAGSTRSCCSTSRTLLPASSRARWVPGTSRASARRRASVPRLAGQGRPDGRRRQALAAASSRHLRTVALRTSAVQADLSTDYHRVSRRRTHHRHRWGLKTQCCSSHVAADHPGVQQDPALYIAIAAAFFTSMILVVTFDYRTAEKAAARGGRRGMPELIVIVVREEGGQTRRSSG